MTPTRIIFRLCLAAATVAFAAPSAADDTDTYLLRTQPQTLEAVLSRHDLTLLATLDTPAGPLHQVRCPVEVEEVEVEDEDPEDEDDNSEDAENAEEEHVEDEDDPDPNYDCSDALLIAIARDPDVVLFEEDKALAIPEVPGVDPLGLATDLADALAQQGLVDYHGTPVWAGYAQQAQLAGIDVAAAHAWTRGAGVVIAVIDGGIDTTHPVLAAAVLAGFDFLTDSSPVPSELDSLDDFTRGALDQSRQAILEQDDVLGLGPGTQAILSATAARSIDPEKVPEVSATARWWPGSCAWSRLKRRCCPCAPSAPTVRARCSTCSARSTAAWTQERAC